MKKKGVRKTGKGKNVGISIFFLRIFFSDCNGRGKQRGSKKNTILASLIPKCIRVQRSRGGFFLRLLSHSVCATPLPVHTCILTHVYTITVHLPGLDTLFHSGACWKSDVCYKNDYKNGFVCLKCIYDRVRSLWLTPWPPPNPQCASSFRWSCIQQTATTNVNAKRYLRANSF